MGTSPNRASDYADYGMYTPSEEMPEPDNMELAGMSNRDIREWVYEQTGEGSILDLPDDMGLANYYPLSEDDFGVHTRKVEEHILELIDRRDAMKTEDRRSRIEDVIDRAA